MNTVQLIGDPKTIFGEVFYKWSQTYAALGRYCDAISPIEMYVSLDPANRRTPQSIKIISDYAEQGKCDKRYATGTTRVPFVGGSAVRTLTVARKFHRVVKQLTQPNFLRNAPTVSASFRQPRLVQPLNQLRSQIKPQGRPGAVG
jgi:hypothetical protein